MKKFTEAEAIAFAESEAWKSLTDRERVLLMFANDGILCMPFPVFHESLEKALGRPVWTHEMGLNWTGLERELLGIDRKPTFEEIVALIPKDKLKIIVAAK